MKLSIANIMSIEPVTAGLIPIGVNVTFRCNHGRESRTYFYNGVQVALAIINGDDPSAYSGIQVEGGGGSSGIASEIGGAVGEAGAIATDIADAGLLL